jgi:ribosomal protein S18 acetylase RimI-like enzyme
MIILNIYVYDKKMHLVKLENNTKKEIFDQVALLHKKSLKKTIASTLSVSSLSNVYFILVRSGIFGILIAQEDSKVVGVLSYKNKKYSTKLLLTLVIYSINGFFKNPIVWIIETYYKIGLYKNVNSKINIVTLFVSEQFQKKLVGKTLIEMVKNEFKTNITVDTRVKNAAALDFYKKNNFKEIARNSKNVVLIYK